LVIAAEWPDDVPEWLESYGKRAARTAVVLANEDEQGNGSGER